MFVTIATLWPLSVNQSLFNRELNNLFLYLVSIATLLSVYLQGGTSGVTGTAGA